MGALERQSPQADAVSCTSTGAGRSRTRAQAQEPGHHGTDDPAGILRRHLRERGGGWQIESQPDQGMGWLGVRHEHARTPAQGWKLHLSATVPAVEVMLRRILPVLLAEEIAFKLAATRESAKYLNAGLGGLSQIGKIVTVYPNDDEQAVRLAVALDEATRDLPGPTIPSDRALAPGSLVHYRYGGFAARFVTRPLGEVVPAIAAPDGRLEPDNRLLAFQPPGWAVDPFVAAGICLPPQPPDPLLGGRYLRVSAFHRAASGDVVLAVDIADGRQVMIKQGRRHGMVGDDGVDARERLRHEAEVLNRLAPDPRFPTPFALFEADGDAYLVMEDVAGEPLEECIAERFQHGRPPSTREIVAWGRTLADMLATIHALGYVYGDLKAGNLIVAPDGVLRLIDFNSIDGPSARLRADGFVTRGYASPQQRPGRAASIADDVYGLGALLYFMASGAEPAQAPHPFALLERPLALLNPASGPCLAAAIAACLERDPARRLASMPEVAAALDAVAGEQMAPPPFGGEGAIDLEDAARQRAQIWARELGGTLLEVARRWRRREATAGFANFPGSIAAPGGGLAGAAGVVLALAELSIGEGDAGCRAGLAAAAQRLAEEPLSDGEGSGGLYTGEGGEGAALLRAGQALADPATTAAALARGKHIAALPHRSPDLMSGTAGRLRCHLLLWDETGDPEQFQAAVAAGERLLAGAEHTSDGACRWPIPAGYGRLSGTAPLGYGRGAAGIADTLLDLFEATGEERFLAAAQRAGAWLARLSQPVGDGSGLGWPEHEHEPLAAASWYRGAGGIARFFLHLATLDAAPGAAEIAARAAHTAARGARMSGPTQCHGLAGNIELLLDAFQATRETAYLTEARVLARLLGTFRIERRGGVAWPGEWPEQFTPDYLTGYAGVASCLLRLAEPEHRPHGLSRAGFRYRPRATSTPAPAGEEMAPI